MRSPMVLLGVSLAALGFCITSGCGGSTNMESTANQVHDSHDHDAHDHDAHDHGSGDHAIRIDADAMGLSADDLVSLDKPDLPTTYADAVTALTKLHGVIRDAFKADDAEAAHNPLHEIGHLLGAIESMVNEGTHDPDHKQELTAAVEELFESYTAVDETFHSDGGKKYSEVEAKIDAAVKTLQEHVDHK